MEAGFRSAKALYAHGPCFSVSYVAVFVLFFLFLFFFPLPYHTALKWDPYQEHESYEELLRESVVVADPERGMKRRALRDAWNEILAETDTSVKMVVGVANLCEGFFFCVKSYIAGWTTPPPLSF